MHNTTVHVRTHLCTSPRDWIDISWDWQTYHIRLPVLTSTSSSFTRSLAMWVKPSVWTYHSWRIVTVKPRISLRDHNIRVPNLNQDVASAGHCVCNNSSVPKKLGDLGFYDRLGQSQWMFHVLISKTPFILWNFYRFTIYLYHVMSVYLMSIKVALRLYLVLRITHV